MSIIAGIHAVREALRAGRPLERVHVEEQHKPSARLREILDLCRRAGVPVRRETRVQLDRLAPGAVHQGVLAVAGARPYAELEAVLERLEHAGAGRHGLLVALDGIEDPHQPGRDHPQRPRCRRRCGGDSRAARRRPDPGCGQGGRWCPGVSSRSAGHQSRSCPRGFETSRLLDCRSGRARPKEVIRGGPDRSHCPGAGPPREAACTSRRARSVISSPLSLSQADWPR